MVTVSSELAKAIRFPSGLNATLKTPLKIPFLDSLRTELSCPVSASHTFTDPSRPADDATRLPSGLNATLTTPASWPLKVRTSCPVATSHNLTVPSALAEAMRFPSGLKATLATSAV